MSVLEGRHKYSKQEDVFNMSYSMTEVMLEHVSVFQELSSTKVTLC